MKFTKSMLAAIVVAFASTTTAIAAETPAVTKPAATKPVKVKKAKKAPKTDAEKAAYKAKSKECSAQADAQKLHGKPRKAFRRACLKKAA